MYLEDILSEIFIVYYFSFSERFRRAYFGLGPIVAEEKEGGHLEGTEPSIRKFRPSKRNSNLKESTIYPWPDLGTHVPPPPPFPLLTLPLPPPPPPPAVAFSVAGRSASIGVPLYPYRSPISGGNQEDVPGVLICALHYLIPVKL